MKPPITGPTTLEDTGEESLKGPEQIRESLREAIFAGELPAGSPISQVKLAAQLGVSRTPLREALRMLESEGLVESERNRRVRVSVFSVTDLEQAYAARIVLEAYGTRLTVPTLTPRRLRELRDDVESMDRHAETGDLDGWEAAHRRLHDGLVERGGSQLVRLIDQLQAHGRRYRSLYVRRQPAEAWARSAVDHEDILRACDAGDAALAGEIVARHLAQTALTMVAATDPSHDPVAIRTALMTVCQS